MFILTTNFGVSDPNPSSSLTRHESVFGAITVAEKISNGKILEWVISEGTLTAADEEADVKFVIEPFDGDNFWHCQAD